MPPLLYALPTTSLIPFSTLLIDPSSSHTTALADATSARTKLQLALKACAGDEPGASALAVVDAVQGYLPYLRGIIACLDADELLLKGDPIFSWRSSLTQSSSSPLLPLPSFHAEHLFVLVTYTLALSNYAHSILASLPTFEPSPGSSSTPHMTSEDEKRTTAGLARAVDLLCQAAGIAQWAAENVCPGLDGIRSATGRVGKHRWPIESSGESLRGLSMTLMADAHLTAIRKLLLPVLPHVLFAPPGPPLPTSHPSPSLLAKLYLHVSSLYNSALTLLQVQNEAPRKLWKERSEPDTVEGEVISQLKRYLRKESLLASALAHKWLGVDAGENGKGARVGEAVAWVNEAQGRLDELEDGKVREKMKGLALGRNNERKKEERKARKGRIERELEDTAAWVRAYTRMNDTVAFQPVPQISSLTMPSGRSIFTVKLFKPPPSKFGPVPGKEDPDHPDESYAGKGNYY